MIVRSVCPYQIQGAYTPKRNNFKRIPPSKEKKYNTAIAICGGMVLLPAIPLIDGDNFRKTIKNRNAAKFVTGMAAIGAGIVGSKLLYEKYSDNKDNTLFNTAIWAASAPLILLVDSWSKRPQKPMAKKWYAACAAAGGLIGFTMSKINNNISKKSEIH